MRVLIVPSWYRTIHQPILGSFFTEQAEALSRKGVEVVLADATSVPIREILGNRLFRMERTKLGVLEEVRFRWPTLLALGNLPLVVKFFEFALSQILQKLQMEDWVPDLIHAHSFFPAGVAILDLIENTRIPLVVTEHRSTVNTKHLSHWERKALIRVVEQATSFICVSNALITSVKDLTDTKRHLEVIPNLVSPHFFDDGLKISHNGFRLISVGGLRPIKAFDLLIQAFAIAFRDQQDVTLDIVGEGPERNRLEHQIAQYELCHKVKLRGVMGRAEIARQMRQSDAFVLASHSETFGVVYAEALACGLPVVATRNGGAEDIIDSRTGFLVEPNNPRVLAEALMRMHREFPLFSSEQIRESSFPRFSESAVTDRLLQIYENSLNCQTFRKSS